MADTNTTSFWSSPRKWLRERTNLGQMVAKRQVSEEDMGFGPPTNKAVAVGGHYNSKSGDRPLNDDPLMVIPGTKAHARTIRGK
jgi:hypothetical protein